MHIPTKIEIPTKMKILSNECLTRLCYRIQIKCNKIYWWITGKQ